MSEVGRNTVKTPENAATILEALRQGHTHKTACAFAGIHPSTFYRWIEEDSEFSDATKKAEADAIEFHVRKITGDPAWQSSAWMLERRFPEQYAKREHLDVTSKGDKIDTVRVIVDTNDNGDS